MFKEHSHIPYVPDDLVIWRFMDFAKFYDLLDSSALFFCPLEKFNDPWEAEYSSATYDQARVAGDMATSVAEMRLSEHIISSLPQISRVARKLMTANCWHHNEHESEAFWRQSQKDIAIRSTVGKLKECIESDKDIYIGKVTYKDYISEPITMGNFLHVGLHKRKSFAYEQEIRAFFIYPPGENLNKIQNTGEHISVNVTKLVDEVVVSPYAGELFFRVVSSLIKKWKLEIPHRKSDLMQAPSHGSAPHP